MFDGVISFVSEQGYKLLKKKGVDCPSCGKRLELPPSLPNGGFSVTIHCSHCPWSGSLESLVQSDRGREGLSRELLPQPEGSKIKESIGKEKATWLIPAKKRLNFLLVFAAVWLAFVGFVTVMVAVGGLHTQGGKSSSPYEALLFLLPFWAIGLGLGYIGLRMSYTEILIRIDSKNITLTRKFFKKIWDKSILRDEVVDVDLTEAYRQNENPVYQVEVIQRDEKKKNLKFGSHLKEEEKRWLVSSLEHFLKVGDAVVFSEKQEAFSEAEEFFGKGVNIQKVGRDGFRITREYRSGPWFYGIGVVVIIGSIIDLFFQWNGFHWRGENDPSWTVIFDFLFEGIPILMALVGLLIGLALLGAGYWATSRKKIFEFGSESLEEVTEWRENQQKQKWQRSEFYKIVQKNTGNVNNEQRFSLSLVGDKQTVKILTYEPQKVVRITQVWIKHWIIPRT